jgi:hypothetical protein
MHAPEQRSPARQIPSPEDRRTAARHKPQEVPWIKGINATGHSGRLIDISSTGVLIETGARLLPGRRTSVLLITADNRRERLEGIVVRSRLVSFGSEGQPVFESAVSFAKELQLAIDGGAPSPGSAYERVSVDLKSRTVSLLEERAA